MAKSGYIVESFGEETCQGYGNLEHKHFSALQAIRRFCWGCQGGHEYPWAMADGKIDKPFRPYEDVRACKSTTCFLHPYRTGRLPSKKPSK